MKTIAACSTEFDFCRVLSRLVSMVLPSAFWVPFTSQLMELRASIRTTGSITAETMITRAVTATQSSFSVFGAQEMKFLVNVAKLYGTEFMRTK